VCLVPNNALMSCYDWYVCVSEVIVDIVCLLRFVCWCAVLTCTHASNTRMRTLTLPIHTNTYAHAYFNNTRTQYTRTQYCVAVFGVIIAEIIVFVVLFNKIKMLSTNSSTSLVVVCCTIIAQVCVCMCACVCVWECVRAWCLMCDVWCVMYDVWSVRCEL